MLFPPILAFVIGFSCAFGGLLWILRVVAQKGQVARGIDRPDGLRKTHVRAVPRLGGIAVFVAFGVLVFFGAVYDQFPVVQKLPAVMTGATLIFLLGLFDDFRPLPARIKLIGQVGIAILVWALGLRVDLILNPLTGNLMELGPLVCFGATLIWLVAIPNVVNFADGMDGIAGGIGLFLSVTLGIVGMLSPLHQGVGVLSFGMAGAMVAFLIFNFPPAKIFLGDGGAYLIGFYIAAASLASSQTSSVGASLMVTMIALGLPILDTLFSLGRRALKGVPVMHGDSEHIHHRLLTLGLSSGKVLFLLYGIFLTLSVIALLTVFYEAFSPWLAIGFLIFLGLIMLRGLGYVRRWRSLGGDLARMVGARQEVRYATALAQALKVEVDRVGAMEFWQIFEHELSRIQMSVHEASEGTEIEIDLAFDELAKWRLYDLSGSQRNAFARKTVAKCFVIPLCLGIKKFGLPDWDGVICKSRD